jgi:hypothetical protein
LGLPQPPTNTSGICSWESSQPKVSITVDPLIDLNFMFIVYLESNAQEPGSDQKKYVVFDPITVGGQPAVVLNTTTHETSSRVLLATSPVDCVNITVTIETGAGARATATGIAEQIVSTLTK